MLICLNCVMRFLYGLPMGFIPPYLFRNLRAGCRPRLQHLDFPPAVRLDNLFTLTYYETDLSVYLAILPHSKNRFCALFAVWGG